MAQDYGRGKGEEEKIIGGRKGKKEIGKGKRKS